MEERREERQRKMTQKWRPTDIEEMCYRFINLSLEIAHPLRYILLIFVRTEVLGLAHAERQGWELYKA